MITYSILGVVSILVMMYSCTKNSQITKNSKEIELSTKDHKISYNATITDSLLNFNLQILNKDGITKMVGESFLVDLRKKEINKIYPIIQQRASLPQYSDISYKEAKNLCSSLQQLIDSSKDKFVSGDKNDPRIQGLYIGMSFLRRILNQKTGFQNKTKEGRSSLTKMMSIIDETNPTIKTPILLSAEPVFEGYLNDDTPFILNEDIIVNVQNLLSRVSQDLTNSQNAGQGLDVFQSALANESRQQITYQELLLKIDLYRLQNRDLNQVNPADQTQMGWWPKGSSHGCCGNYKGKCWYWHPYCYLHDKMCSNCKPRILCFSGCVPDVRDQPQNSINTNPILTVIEDAGIPGT